MKIKYDPQFEAASKIGLGEICLIDKVPHKRVKDDGPALAERRSMLPFLVDDTIYWIHADTLVQPRRKVSVDKVPVGVGFLLESGAEYVRLDVYDSSFADPDSAKFCASANEISRIRVLAMQVSTGRVMVFSQTTQVVCVDTVAVFFA